MPVENIRRLTAIVQLTFTLHATTGLRIGASDSSIAIGGNDNPVVRHPVTGQPYVPGSSLKGKMRSLLERVHGLEQTFAIDRERVMIHVCQKENDYAACFVCQLFGAPAPRDQRWFCQTRLRFADMFLTSEAVQWLREANTDLPFTEMKSEVAIDRVVAAAVPRTMERVPAGATFGPARIGLFLYESDQTTQYLDYLIQGLELVEADYLGGSGSRGSGRVAFQGIGLDALRFPVKTATTERETLEQTFADVRALRDQQAAVASWSARPA